MFYRPADPVMLRVSWIGRNTEWGLRQALVGESQLRAPTDLQLNMYWSKGVPSSTNNVLLFWDINKACYPHALKFLSVWWVINAILLRLEF